ncbi:MAG: beta-lactamase family protein [Colwellia sp.]
MKFFLVKGFFVVIFSFFSIISSANKFTRISGEIDQFMSAGEINGYSGGVIVSMGGKVLFSKGYGYAHRKNKIENSDQIVFDIGSNTKQFTAACILKMVEDDKILLSSPISKFFSNVPPDKASITIHQLLNHTSGLPESLGRDSEVIDLKTLLNRAFSSKLSFPSGSQLQYSNVGYSLLAAIIEEVSGKSYEGYLNSILLQPAGLKNTGYLLPEWPGSKLLAAGYKNTIENVGSTIDVYKKHGVTWNLIGNGGLNATLEDLHKWMYQLVNFKVLNQKNTLRLFARQFAPDENSNWHAGYGWFASIEHYGSAMIIHDGSNGIFQSSIRWFPKEKIIILSYSNSQYSEVERVVGTIADIILKPNVDPLPLQMSPYQVALKFSQNNKPEKINNFIKYVATRTNLDVNYKRVINRVGSYFLKERNYLWANAFFNLNVELSPDDGNLWDSLGEGQITIKQYKTAKASFIKAIELGKGVNCYWCKNSQNKIVEISKYLEP